jgi:YHS domain-containing protein
MILPCGLWQDAPTSIGQPLRSAPVIDCYTLDQATDIILERTCAMRARLIVAACAAVALIAVQGLRAADEKPALKCPVSGKATQADKTVDFNGGKVQFCCENCPKAFNANPKKFAGKANLQLIQTGQLVQVKCPLTARPVAADKTVEIDGVKIGVCCGNCLAKATKVAGNEQIDLLLSDPKPGSFEAAKK